MDSVHNDDASFRPTRTLVQCDFDGTVTIEDVAFIMLDAYARGDWRKIHDEYEAAKISVGRFNEAAFDLVRATRRELLESMKGNVTLRPGFPGLVECCRRRDFRLVIVSNGLDFYIREVLRWLGSPEIEVHAARTRFHSRRVKVQYIGPDGATLDDAFKEAYVSHYLSQGYRVVYVGNGSSDYLPAKKCHHIFATGTLLRICREKRERCFPFSDFGDVTAVLDTM